MQPPYAFKDLANPIYFTVKLAIPQTKPEGGARAWDDVQNGGEGRQLRYVIDHKAGGRAQMQPIELHTWFDRDMVKVPYEVMDVEAENEINVDGPSIAASSFRPGGNGQGAKVQKRCSAVQEQVARLIEMSDDATHVKEAMVQLDLMVDGLRGAIALQQDGSTHSG